MATSILTQLRQSIWAAIDGSSDFSGTFKAKRKFEDKSEVYDLTNPWEFFALGDLPGIAVVPAGAASPWVTNQQQGVRYQLNVVMIGHSWNILHQEKFWQYLHRALWTNSAGYPLTVAQPNLDIGNGTIEQGGIVDGDGEDAALVAATKIEFPVVLEYHWNPRTDTGTLT